MAFVETTLNSAMGIDDTFMDVASATSFAAGRLVQVDQEMMLVTKDYSSGTIVNVLRGQNGTRTRAHFITTRVVHSLVSDWPAPMPGTFTNTPLAGKAREVRSVTAATSTLTLPTAGTDLYVVLNGTAVITLTIPVPTKDLDGTLMWIVSNGVAAHLLTFTGGLSGAGASYDIITLNATAPSAYCFTACNDLWYAVCGPAISGTTTNIAGAIA